MRTKPFIQLYKGIFVLVISVIAFSSCKKITDAGGTTGGTTSDPNYLKNLLAYKKKCTSALSGLPGSRWQ